MLTISGFLGSYLGYHYDRLGLFASVLFMFLLDFSCIFSIAIKAKTSAWWDFENFQVPKGADALSIARNISSALINMNYRGPVSIFAYGDTTRIPASIQKALSSTGIALNYVPAGVKDESDKKILVDMLLWAVDNPAPANYLLISGDGDFSNALHQLCMRRYNILLAQPPQASAALVAAAKSVWLWSTLAGGGAPLSSDDKSQLANCMLASSYEHHVVNQAPAVAPDGMRIPALRYNYSPPQSLCDSNIGGNENCVLPIQSTMAISTSFPIVRPDKIQGTSFQRESTEIKQFKTAPHEFFGVGRSISSSCKLDPKPPSDTADFLDANGYPQRLPALPSVPGNPLIQPVAPRDEPPQVNRFNYHEPSPCPSQFSSVISADALNISNLNLAESMNPVLYSSQFNANGSRPKFAECKTPVSYGDSHGGHGHNVQQYPHPHFNFRNHFEPVPPSLAASCTVSGYSVEGSRGCMQPPSDYVQGLVGVVILALNTLKGERIIPTEANISDCIRYGDYRFLKTDVKKALENALTQRMIVKQSVGALQLYVGKNDKLWSCVNPISGNLSDYSSAMWDQIDKFLSSTAGRDAVLASKSRYEAALILKRGCLEDHTLGVVLQILNMVCTKKKWIIHRQPGWQPIIITVTETKSASCEKTTWRPCVKRSLARC